MSRSSGQRLNPLYQVSRFVRVKFLVIMTCTQQLKQQTSCSPYWYTISNTSGLTPAALHCDIQYTTSRKVFLVVVFCFFNSDDLTFEPLEQWQKQQQFYFIQQWHLFQTTIYSFKGEPSSRLFLGGVDETCLKLVLGGRIT